MSRGIALLAESLDPARGGGAERAIRATARALARAGVDTALVGPRRRLGPGEPGIRVLGLDLDVPGRARRARALAAELAPFARRELGDVRLVATGKLLGADALWSHGGVHAVARKAAAAAGRGPVLAALARLGRALRPVEGAFDAIERENAAAARAGALRAIALSERVRRHLARVHGLEPAATPVVRNGVEIARFALPGEERARARAELAGRAGLAAGETLALFVGHAFALKGLDRAIRGLAHAPRARLLVVGRGDRRGPEALARKAGVADRVAFAGALDSLERLLGGADVLVHPSRFDPCSLVVLEAFAASVPVIASSADGSSELVRAGAGWVLEDADDAQELGACLRQLEDPARRAALSAGSRACARSTDDVARELLAVLAP